MKLQPENAESQDAVYEGVLTSDDEGNYWITQGQTSAQLDTRGLDESILEENDGEAISIVGTLFLEQIEDSAILSYELEPRIVAPLEGFNPENNTYITRVGDDLIEAYSDGVEEFEGDPEDLEDVDEVAY